MPKTITTLLHHPLQTMHRRLLRTAPGSVLILVVALLVLLALLGTAYISTTRIDRYTSTQNAANTQIDLLMDGVVNAVKGAIVGDLFDQSSGNYRQPQTLTASSDSYVNFDSPAVKPWLSSRIPDPRNNANPYSADATNLGTGAIPNPGGWEDIALPLFTSSQQYQFDQPGAASVILGKQWSAWSNTATYGSGDIVMSSGPKGLTFYTSLQVGNTNNPPSSSPTWWIAPAVSGPPGPVVPQTPKATYRYEPTVLGGMPAFRRVDQNGNIDPNTYLAADTDHDGAADALLCKIPVGILDGVTYYAAYRVVDNNAAINVNTADSLTCDVNALGTVLQSSALNPVANNPSLFTSNIGLLELLDPTSPVNEIRQLRNYRLNLLLLTGVGYDGSLATPYADTPVAARTDFVFMSQGDELYHQLARRIGNPGYTGTGIQMQAVSLNDAATLASGFCIHNTSSSSTLESTLLNYSINNVNGGTGGNYKAPTQPYDPGATGNWFLTNFDYTSTINISGQFPLRALLTTINGGCNRTGAKTTTAASVLSTSTVVPVGTKLYPQDVINPGMTPYDPPVADPTITYAIGNWIKYKTLPNGPWGVYRCLQASTTVANLPDAATRQTPTAFWAREPWTPTPTKTSINTATFPELWRSFYNVMSDKWNTAPNTVTAHVGTAMFKQVLREPAASLVPAGVTPALTDIQMVQLRAAISAINTIALRDTSNNIPSRNIILYDDPDPTSNPTATARAPVAATVFGGEKQPFITKVIVVQQSATTWWVGIELYNPYVSLQYPAGEVPGANPVTFYMGARTATTTNDIGLGCRIGVVTRSATAAPALTEVVPDWVTVVPPPIGPGQYLLLASSATLPPGVSTSAANAGRVVVVAGLDALAGTSAGGLPAEVVLYRTRLATGVQSTSAGLTPAEVDPTKTYNEANLWENVPFDQIDLTGTAAFTPNSVYYYSRPTQVNVPMPANSAAARNYWKCVYPIGPTATYTPVAAVAPAAAGEPIPLDAAATAAAPLMLCEADPALAGVPWYQIQINNIDWPSPHVIGVTNVYPLGGFARNGDMLQIPFIGSYSLYTATVPTVLPATMLEVNSVTMDALYAEDSPDTFTVATHVAADDPVAADLGPEMREQIGRFCPLTAAPTADIPAFPAGTTDPYAWASRLFDYFTVQAPHDDYLPNVDPDSYYRNNPAVTPNPPGVSNAGGTANYNEDAIPVQGQININTADWKVLSMLPLVRAANGTVDIANTRLMARAIVRYREANGPFQSIFDLNKVVDTTSAAVPAPGFQNGYGMMDFTYARTNDVDNRQGDMTPNDAANPYPGFASIAPYSPTDGVTGDFKEKFLAITRISNLITTRSDSFTCYAMVQGWRNGSLVAQRRAAFIIDRSTIGYQLDGNGNRQMVTTPFVKKVPTN